MINGLGIVGFGVGGIEAGVYFMNLIICLISNIFFRFIEAVMLGQCTSMVLPEGNYQLII